MTETFTWEVSVGTSGRALHRARKAQFGDGYSQHAGDGINAKVQTWNVVRVCTNETDKDAIEAFLDARAGYESFFWTPPGGSQGYYLCESYDTNPLGADAYTITATFQQVFQP